MDGANIANLRKLKKLMLCVHLEWLRYAFPNLGSGAPRPTSAPKKDSLTVRSSLTMTTQLLGESPMVSPGEFQAANECDIPLLEYLFPQDDSSHRKEQSHEVYINKLQRWIEARGPQVPSNHIPAGNEPVIKEIWDMMRAKDAALEDMNKVMASRDVFVKKIELARMFT